MDEVSTVKEAKEEKEKRKRKKDDGDSDESSDSKRRRRDDRKARHKNHAITEPPSSVSADTLPEATSIPPALPSTSNSSESFPVRSHPLVPSPPRNLDLDLELDLEPPSNLFGLDLSRLRFTASSPPTATATTANTTAPAPVPPVPANASSNAKNAADSVPTPNHPAPSLTSPPETNIVVPVPVVKVNNPLAGKFKSVSRLDPVYSAPPAPPVASTSTSTSSSVSITAPTSASTETAISALAPTSETEIPALKKAKPHRPGAAHTPWNLFARDHMALPGNGRLSHDEVEAAWKALRQSKPEQEKATAATSFLRNIDVLWNASLHSGPLSPLLHSPLGSQSTLPPPELLPDLWESWRVLWQQQVKLILSAEMDFVAKIRRFFFNKRAEALFTPSPAYGAPCTTDQIHRLQSVLSYAYTQHGLPPPTFTTNNFLEPASPPVLLGDACKRSDAAPEPWSSVDYSAPSSSSVKSSRTGRPTYVSLSKLRGRQSRYHREGVTFEPKNRVLAQHNL
ncbi:hypothetical protein B0H19DRAFT_1258721 [Mycena capillaripes]|nr:hypothetical protein B0H19DRAFT_1258721 [Mycena capillaripes]